jgi:hypothetical protein
VADAPAEEAGPATVSNDDVTMRTRMTERTDLMRRHPFG